VRLFKKKKNCNECGRLLTLDKFRTDTRGNNKKVCIECEKEIKRLRQVEYGKKVRDEKKVRRQIRAEEAKFNKGKDKTYVRCSLCKIRIGKGTYEFIPVNYMYAEPKYINIKGKEYPFDKDCYERAIIMPKEKLLEKLNAQKTNDSRFKENS